MSIKGLFSRVKTIPHPDLTKENWGEKQPLKKIKIGSIEFYLSQPMSSFLVYLLGVLVIAAGIRFFLIQDGQLSRYWFGIAFILWGVGALIAGISYQTFGYELKAARKDVCVWTSWFEIIYLIIQQWSMNAMTIAVAYACTTGLLQDILIWYAIAITIIYPILTLIGAFVPIKSLITFEWMVEISLPSFIIFLVLNSVRYIHFGDTMDLVLLGSWILIYLSWWGYIKYWKSGLTEKLWKKGKGIWFSDNDVLHVILIIWALYILFVMPEYIKDFQNLI
ncbi:hypothetical protein AwErysi_07660 [Erysipelotrichaceae bacterium]|nr:hypothetical protein AwErysi_07660 [Erysipelotrichaceae bacterium]